MEDQDSRLMDLRYDITKFYGVGRTADAQYNILKKLVSRSVTEKGADESDLVSDLTIYNDQYNLLRDMVRRLEQLEKRVSNLPSQAIDNETLKLIIRERPSNFSAYWLQKRDPIVYQNRLWHQLFYYASMHYVDSKGRREWHTFSNNMRRNYPAFIGGEQIISNAGGTEVIGETYINGLEVLDNNVCTRNVVLTEILPRSVEYKVVVYNMDPLVGDWATAAANIGVIDYDNLVFESFCGAYGLVQASEALVIGTEYGRIKELDFDTQSGEDKWNNKVVDENLVQAAVAKPKQEAALILSIFAAVMGAVAGFLGSAASAPLQSLTAAANKQLAALEKNIVTVVSTAGLLAARAVEYLEETVQGLNVSNSAVLSGAVSDVFTFRDFQAYSFRDSIDDYAYVASFSAGWKPDDNYQPWALGDLERRRPSFQRFAEVIGTNRPRQGAITRGDQGAVDNTGFADTYVNDSLIAYKGVNLGVYLETQLKPQLYVDEQWALGPSSKDNTSTFDEIDSQVYGVGPILREGVQSEIGAKRWSVSNLRKKLQADQAYVQVPIDVTLNNPIGYRAADGSPGSYAYNMVCVDNRVVAIYYGGWITAGTGFENAFI